MANDLNSLLRQIRACRHCEKHLELGPRPILTASAAATILIAGQAPGRRVHESGTPWDDPSGDRLREWLQIDKETFYDETKIALVPMGFCFPGSGKSGDLPPRRECRKLWHDRLMSLLKGVELSILVGNYAQDYHLGNRRKKNLTETVRAWQEYAPKLWPVPHPSPRNQRWLKQNPWFMMETLPVLRKQVGTALGFGKSNIR